MAEKLLPNGKTSSNSLSGQDPWLQRYGLAADMAFEADFAGA